MTGSRRRRYLIGALVVLIAVGTTAFLATSVGPMLSVGLAYKAKTLCSESFVAGRPHDDVLADLTIDDLRPLRMIRGAIDTTTRVATARFLAAERTAHFIPGFGCALSFDGAATRPRDALSRADAAGDSFAPSPHANQALEQVLDAAFSEPRDGHMKRTRAVVVLHRGEVVAERYAPGIGPHTPLPGWSMTKSVLNALVGIALRDGVLTLDEPTGLGAWSGPGDDRARITVSDLLRMSSGLRFDEDQASASSDILRMLYGTPDMALFAADMPLAAAPGTVWSYSTGTSLVLSRLLRERLGDDAYHAFPRMALFEPLGLEHATLEIDAAGTFVAGSYMYATAREWARFGQLYLQDGVWQGRRILPEGWVAYTRTPAPAHPRASYGAHFWLSTPAEYRGPAADVPPDMYHAAGHEAQFITIIPSHDVVIVRLGRTRYPSAWEHDRFVVAVLAGLRQANGAEL